jgi:hypothetical protein
MFWAKSSRPREPGLQPQNTWKCHPNRAMPFCGAWLRQLRAGHFILFEDTRKSWHEVKVTSIRGAA